jgi:hypothetical protein
MRSFDPEMHDVRRVWRQNLNGTLYQSSTSKTIRPTVGDDPVRVEFIREVFGKLRVHDRETRPLPVR